MVVVNTHELLRKPKDPDHCFYCGLLLVKAKTYDHVEPSSRAGLGANLPCNLKIACKICNSKKSCMTLEQFRKLCLAEYLIKFWKRGIQLRIKRFQFYGERHPEQCRFQFKRYNYEEREQSQELRASAAVAGA